jgi:hypothetical protein
MKLCQCFILDHDRCFRQMCRLTPWHKEAARSCASVNHGCQVSSCSTSVRSGRASSSESEASDGSRKAKFEENADRIRPQGRAQNAFAHALLSHDRHFRRRIQCPQQAQWFSLAIQRRGHGKNLLVVRTFAWRPLLTPHHPGPMPTSRAACSESGSGRRATVGGMVQTKGKGAGE